MRLCCFCLLLPLAVAQQRFEPAVSAANGPTLYGRINNGLVQSSDSGRSWQPLYITGAGEAQPDGDIRIDTALTTILYLPSRQFWKSTNAGQTWTASSTGLPAATMPTLFRQAGNGSLYLRYGNLLYKSANRGDAWAQIATLPGSSPIFDIALANPERMYYVDGTSRTVQSSDDEGRTWKVAGTLQVPGLVTGSVHTIGIVTPETIYLSIGCSCVANTPRSYVSKNGGQTFDPAPDGLSEFTTFTPYRDNFLYTNNIPSGISRSRTGGTSWSTLFNVAGIGVVSFSAADSSAPATIYGSAVTATNERINIRSTDAGDSWTLLNATLTPTLATPPLLDVQLAEGAISTHTLRIQTFEDPAWPLGISATAAVPWLTLSAATGSTPFTPTLALNASGLAPGIYDSTIELNAPQSFNKTARARIRLTVVPRGTLGRQYLISTVAGNGGTYEAQVSTAPAANFAIGTPLAVAVDPANRLLVASGPRLLRLENGALTAIAGGPAFGTTGDGGAPLDAALASISAIVPTSSGELYLNEQSTPKVRRIAANRIESYLDRTKVPAFAGSSGLARDAAGRLVLINSNRLVRFDGQSFTNLTTYVFSTPRAIAIAPSGIIYVANAGTDQIIQIAANGEASVFAGTGTAGFAGDNGPAPKAQLNDPFGLAIDSQGNVFVGDERNHRIRAIGTDSIIRTIAGSGIEGFAGDGANALAAALNRPGDLALDPAGNLYIADRINQRVRKLTPNVPPTATISGLLHGASGDTNLSPGSLFSLYGAALASGRALSDSTPWPTSLGGATVTINGIAAPLYYVSPTQVNGQIPYETAPGTATATIGGASVQFPVMAANPGVLVYNGDHAVAVNYPSGAINGPTTPALPGDVVLLYFTGLGRPDVPVTTGAAAPNTEPFARSAYPYEIRIANQPVTVNFFGLAPGYPALCQANFAIPDLPAGEHPLVITVNGQPSRPVMISVR